jgi:hypothetical protein
MYKEQATKYLNWINENYNKQKNKLIAFCNDKNYQWDEDIFCDTYLKIYDKILKDGIKDDSDKGFDAYTFMSFKINTMREGEYARNQKRDLNVTNINEANERYKSSLLTQEEKLKSDLYKDFATLYLMKKVESNFDNEHFYLFRLKTFDKNMTYQRLAEKTGIKGVRQKVVNVRNWLKANVTKKEIDDEFSLIYQQIL